jgi:hypothetical protein
MEGIIMSAQRPSVVFSGENPGLTLYKPGTDQVVAAASYWRCVYSEHGEGNVLLIWVDQSAAAGGSAPHAIYADNDGVAKLVATNFTQYFGPHQKLGWDGIEPTHARFFQESDSRWYHRVVCNPGDEVIELLWWDVLDQQMRYNPDMQLGPNRWELHTVICPCASASISISNQPVTGEVQSSTEGGTPMSSCFLAFSETWLKL